MLKFEVEGQDRVGRLFARAGKISDAGISVRTPLRVLNSTELNHGKKITSSGLATANFPHQVFEITKLMKEDRINQFIKDADTSSILTKQIKNISKLADLRLTIFHPIIKKEIEITEEINTKLIAMQLDADIDLISILDEYNSKPEKFEKRLSSSIEQINNVGQYAEPMPTIRIDTDETMFRKKMDIAIKAGVRVININYANIHDHWENYVYLVESAHNGKTKKTWIHMSEVPRKMLRLTSTMHLLTLLGIDSYALDSKQIPLGLIERKEVKAKRFDAVTITYPTIDEYISLYGDNPNCPCFVEIRKKLSDTISSFQTAELLSSAITCHESIASYYELINARQAILNKKYKEYLLKKKGMSRPLKEVLKIDLAQQQL